MARLISSFSIINAEKLLTHIDSGHLAIRGGIKAVTFDPISTKYLITFERDGIQTVESFDILFNSCGSTLDIKSNTALYSGLNEQKLVEFTIYGSLDADTETFRVRSQLTDRVYGCGPVAAGNLMVVNFIRGIQPIAKAIVKDLMKRISAEGRELNL